MMYNPANFDYFKSPDRAGETVNVTQCLLSVYDEIMPRLRTVTAESTQQLINYQSYSDYPLIYKLDEILSDPKVPDENSKCDEIFSFYLFKVSRCANSDCFIRVARFVFLFRECLNLTYIDRVRVRNNWDQSYHYSSYFNAEDAPDISNEFVTEYLTSDPKSFDYTKDEAIDLTQNFCQWLYDNNYTCSKLSLISCY